MSARRPFGLVDVLLALLVLAVAAGVRVYYLKTAAEGGRTSGPILVQDAAPTLSLPPETTLRDQANPSELDALVHNLSKERWFGSLAPFAGKEEKTAHVAPGYPWLLGHLARVVPAEDFATTVRWAQCGLGALTALLYFLFARRAFESRLVALLAGLFTALHPFWVINAAALNDGTLTAFLLAVVLLLANLAGRSGNSLLSLLFGLSVAGLALVRAPLLPFALVSVLWLLWRSRRLEGGWMCAILVFLGFFIGLGPWAVRNFLEFKEPVPICSSTYYHLWMGNNPQATGGPLSEEDLLKGVAEKRGVALTTLRDLLANEPQPRRYRQLATHVLDEIRANPDRTIELRLRAALYFYLSESLTVSQRVATTTTEETPSALTSLSLSLLLVVLALMLPLAVLAWRWTYPWREESTVATLALIWMPLPYVLGHAAHLHGPRMPLDGIFLSYAAFLVACLWPPTSRLLSKGFPSASSSLSP